MKTEVPEQKMPAPLFQPIVHLARTQLEDLVKNLDAELVLDCVSKKMFDNFSMWDLQVNLCQKLLFLHQLTHNMTTDCSLNYMFNTWKFQAQNMGTTCCVQKLFWMSKQKQKTICVHNMFSPCSELGIFMYWSCNLMNNLSWCCGLVDAKIRASDKDLPVLLG